MRSLPQLPESKRAEMVAAARSYVGARWAHQKRSKRAVDCIGLVAVSLRDIGVDGEDVRGYEREPDGVRLRQGMVERFGDPVDEWREGDVVLLRWNTSGGLESHVGIIGSHRGLWTLIHSWATQKRVVEHLIDATWAARIADVFSLTGDADVR